MAKRRRAEPAEADPAIKDPDFSFAHVGGVEKRYGIHGGREVAVDLRDSRRYRAHLRLMKRRSFEEIIAAVDPLVARTEEDMERDFEPSLMLWLDVRFQPNYWIELKEEAARRRDKRAQQIIRAAEKAFRSFESGKPGRPKMDIEGRRARARAGVLGDLPQVAQIVKRIWRDHDRDDEEEMTSPPEALIRFAINVLGVPARRATASIGKTWRRPSLERKALAAHLLYLKWNARTGLRESDVARIITPAWRSALG